jgi:hypothetical protein
MHRHLVEKRDALGRVPAAGDDGDLDEIVLAFLQRRRPGLGREALRLRPQVAQEPGAAVAVRVDHEDRGALGGGVLHSAATFPVLAAR